ncbi:MAG TPA: DUF2914 domain-containing protein [Polyangiaceae bacterium]|jgi:hypothetical protein
MRTPIAMKLGLFALLASAASACSKAPLPAPLTCAPVAAAPGPVPAVKPSASTLPATPLAAAPAPDPKPASVPRHATDLHVERLVVARGVEGREPQGADTLFSTDEKRVFAFLEVDNPERAPGQLEVQFVAPDGKAQPPIDVSVGDAPRWRTWAFTRQAKTPGTWKAIVRNERGHVVASTEFDVHAG